MSSGAKVVVAVVVVVVAVELDGPTDNWNWLSLFAVLPAVLVIRKTDRQTD